MGSPGTPVPHHDPRSPSRSSSLPSAKMSANANCLFSSSSRFTPSSSSSPPPPPSFLSSSWVKNNQVSGKQQPCCACLPALAPRRIARLGSLRPLLAALSFLLPTPYRDLTNMLGLCLPAQLERNLTIAWPGEKEWRAQTSAPHPGPLVWVPARPCSLGCCPEDDGGEGMHGASTPRRVVVPAPNLHGCNNPRGLTRGCPVLL